MHDHDHAHVGGERLLAATLVNMFLAGSQILGGLLSGSLSLVANALQNLGDAITPGLAFVASHVDQRPADSSQSFCFRRAEAAGVIISQTVLIVIGSYLIYEASSRYLTHMAYGHPTQPIAGWTVVWVAGLALVIELVTTALTYRLSNGHRNIRAAFAQNASSALTSVGVVVAGFLILLNDWCWADLTATVLISAYVLVQGVTKMRDTVRTLLEGVPPDVSLEEVSAALAAIPGVQSVHHIHVWQLDETHRALEAHVVVQDASTDSAQLKAVARQILMEQFQVGHSTLELELPGEKEA